METMVTKSRLNQGLRVQIQNKNFRLHRTKMMKRDKITRENVPPQESLYLNINCVGVLT